MIDFETMTNHELDILFIDVAREKRKREKCVKVISVGTTHYEFLDREGRPIDAYQYRQTKIGIPDYNFGLFSSYNLCDEVTLKCTIDALVVIYERIIILLYEKGYTIKYAAKYFLVFEKKCL